MSHGCDMDSSTRQIACRRYARWANHLKLWRLCGNAKCRRARAYRGKVHLCARPTYRKACAISSTVAQAQEEGLNFEDVIERLDESGAVEAFED